MEGAFAERGGVQRSRPPGFHLVPAPSWHLSEEFGSCFSPQQTMQEGSSETASLRGAQVQRHLLLPGARIPPSFTRGSASPGRAVCVL